VFRRPALEQDSTTGAVDQRFQQLKRVVVEPVSVVDQDGERCLVRYRRRQLG
jgi:hypothetical protein